ncbi:MAG: hypothetical protein JRG73_17835 [Deltaproteobacteria bacterium]|nr:hypothetical protein [Deltaproteobacteria bacterium]MBW2308787.1 hypothetical protein [Deltaproteobacteria bacterium]
MLRIYTISGVESYLGIVEEVTEHYVVVKSFFKGYTTYIVIQHIESF